MHQVRQVNSRVRIRRIGVSVNLAAVATHSVEANVSRDPRSVLHKLIENPGSTYHTALKAFNELRSRGLKLGELQYLSLLYKALREGRYERVWGGYEAFLEDEKQEKVGTNPRARTTWPRLTPARMQMHRFVLWAMLDADRGQAMTPFYQSEVVGKYNVLRIHEADPFNFLLRMECTIKVTGEQEHGLRLRLETLLNTMERLELHTSYSSTHGLVRIILHRPEIFFDFSTDEEDADQDLEAGVDTKYTAEAMGKMIIEYMARFPCAVALDPKRLSIAVSAAAAAGQHDAAKLLLEYGLTQRVPIDAGSFAHAVESAPDDASRLKVADLYMHAKEHDLVYITQGTDSSIVNYLLQHAILDGNFKHMMELLHEMQLYSNKQATEPSMNSSKVLRSTERRSTEEATNMKVAGGGNRPNVQRLWSCSKALWNEDVKLRPEIYSQLLYPLLAGGQRGGDESSDASVFDRLEVERCFDRQYPRQRTHLNSLVVNICQSNDDFSTMLVCLDRWQKERDEVLSGTTFIVDGMELSYWAFLVRYRRIVTWDAWTIEYAIVRARTGRLHADVVALLAEADSRGLVLNSTAYVVSLCVLEEVGEPSAVVACAERMKANDAWEKAVSKDPEVQEILNRASAKLEEPTVQELAVHAALHQKAATGPREQGAGTFGVKIRQVPAQDAALVDSEPKVTLEPPPITVGCDALKRALLLTSEVHCAVHSMQVTDVALEPLTVSKCHQISSQAFKEIKKFMADKSYLTTGLELFGWREQRREASDHVKFTLKKRFIGSNPLGMSTRAWRVVSSPRGLAGLYSSAMHLSMKVLQVVDDHNVIMYRVITNTSTKEAVQSLFLVSRFQMDSGYVILFRSVDRNRLRKIRPDGTIGDWDGGKQDKWLDMFTWYVVDAPVTRAAKCANSLLLSYRTLFEDEPENENAVVFSYGGIVYSTLAVTTRVWMLEILSLALRWENKVVGPTLMLSG
ncbi:hypothetical protein GQ600_21446 [Phytophthora cactorum]|nr:hypothetical protein GQ600_21446 [Phytophthora cactorum]